MMGERKEGVCVRRWVGGKGKTMGGCREDE
jgi:hypothetical protein